MCRLFAILPLTLLIVGCDAVRRVDAGGGRVVVEAAVFEGGYGIHWHQKMAAAFTAQQGESGPAVRLWGDPRVAEKIKPRFLRGDPPDFVIDYNLPVWLLVASNNLRPLDDALDRPLPGMNTPWRDLFIEGTLRNYSAGGRTYAVPSAFGAYTIWYDARQFREHGWSIPQTWEDFDALCTRIRRAGIAPLAYQGKYPLYGWWIYNSLVHRCGGLAAINRINALEPGAFLHPDAVWAARLLQEMAMKHFQPGALAMSHTESQLQFVNNKAAMIFCGLWLYNEMKASIPPGFELRCFNVPPIAGGKGNPRLFDGSGWEYAYIPARGRRQEEAIEFLRFMISPQNAPDMGRSIGVISPLKDGTPRDSVPPPLQSALDLIEASEGIFHLRLDSLLISWRTQIMEPAMAALMRGELSPERFCQTLEDGVAAAKANPDNIIPPYDPIDPARHGEAT